MTRSRIVLAALAAALLVPAVAYAKTTVNGSVGPGFSITLKSTTGQTVKTLKPGVTVFRVNDRSDIHNFHLTGPGVNKATSVTGTGAKTWTVTLKRGTYRFVCDPHDFSMKGSFKVV